MMGLPRDVRLFIGLREPTIDKNFFRLPYLGSERERRLTINFWMEEAEAGMPYSFSKFELRGSPSILYEEGGGVEKKKKRGDTKIEFF